MAFNVQESIYSELADFLVSQPSLEEIAGYQVSDSIQQHIDTLLNKNREGGISADERLELEKFLAVSQVMTLTKTKAQLKLDGKL